MNPLSSKKNRTFCKLKHSFFGRSFKITKHILSQKFSKWYTLLIFFSRFKSSELDINNLTKYMGRVVGELLD